MLHQVKGGNQSLFSMTNSARSLIIHIGFLYGYKVEKEIPLTPSKYFNQSLLHYTQKFVSDNDYIFFAHTVLQKVQLSSQINIAMKQVLSNDLTPGMLSKNFKQRVQEFIAKELY